MADAENCRAGWLMAWSCLQNKFETKASQYKCNACLRVSRPLDVHLLNILANLMMWPVQVQYSRFNTFYAIFPTKSSTENDRKKMKMGTKGSFWYTFWNWHYVEWPLLLIGCSRYNYTDPSHFKIFKYQTVNWLGWYKDCLPEVSYCGEANMQICLTGSFDRNFASVHTLTSCHQSKL